MKYNFVNVTKRVMDRFFKVIAKNGALVTLGKAGNKPSLSQLFSKIGFRMFGAVFTGKGNYSSRIRQLNAFYAHVIHMNRNHGTAYVVKYLKTSQLAIQKAIAGTPVSSLCALEPMLFFPYVSASGLPRIIPVRDRRLMIGNGSPSVIRWWLTLFSVYRVIYIPTTLKLSTITDPLTVPVAKVNEVAVELLSVFKPSMLDLSLLGNAQFLFLESASATNSVSWLGFISDTFVLQARGLHKDLFHLLNLMGNHHMARFFLYLAQQVKGHTQMMGLTSHMFRGMMSLSPAGRLSIKEEAAGKARVFAMVDSWTQMAMKPLHDMIFKLLRTLPNDATFNQEASVKRCMEKSMLTGKSFGYDLSAATDRLPIQLQIAILNSWLSGLGDVWARVLVGRDYVLKGTKKRPEQVLQYAVGQPMGALSSWAMLDVTHHAIAQLAARRVAVRNGALTGPFWTKIAPMGGVPVNWYTGYECLGDDIVFFEEDIASEYLLIMADIGVPINLGKSVVATNATFEFAKVTGHRGKHVAAISWAMFMAQPTLMGRAQIGYALCSKGIINAKPIKVLTTLARQSKYKVGSPNVFFLALGTMFAKKGRIPWLGFLYSIMQKTAGYYNVYQTLLEKANITSVVRAIAETVKTGSPAEIPHPLSRWKAGLPTYPFLQRGYKADEFALKQTIISAINAFINGSKIDGKVVHALNPQKDAMALALSIMRAPILMLSPGASALKTETPDLLPLYNKGVFSWNNRVLSTLSPREEFLHYVFLFLSRVIYDKLITLRGEIVFEMGDLHGLPIEKLMDLVDKIDRYREILAVLDRAHKKLGHELQPDRNLIESPLEALKVLLDMDDPFGAYSDQVPAFFGGQSAFEYMYVLERLDNLPISDQSMNLIGEMSPSSFYLRSFGPVAAQFETITENQNSEGRD